MKKFILFLLLACPVLAQDMPKPKPMTCAELPAEIGKLYLQVSNLSDYVVTLQNEIANLQAENAKLKKGAQ